METHFRADIDSIRAIVDGALRRGASGHEACEMLSGEYDRIVKSVWQQALAQHDEIPESYALVATGGWGRQAVCPRSDIDFILLCRSSAMDNARRLAEQILYPLWDAGIRVGHAVRTPREAARLAVGDLSTATALLDLRRVVGSSKLVESLKGLTRTAVAPGGNANDFVTQLDNERQRRHSKFGDSLYLLEPNLKHGIGALRDLETALWASKARWSVQRPSELVPIGQLTVRQAKMLQNAHEFLLRLRTMLHLYAGRATDQLTFEIQETIGPVLYPDTAVATASAEDQDGIRLAVAPAVEALMQRYYLHARDVVWVTERLLETARVPARKKPRIRRIDGAFLTFNGKLSANDLRVFRDRPAEILRLFRVALREDIPIYGHTKDYISEHLAQSPEVLQDNPLAAEHFLELLTDHRDSRQPSLLAQMHQIGILSAIMPEFRPCTCRVQHDLYHVYTVDQHLLMTVAMLKRLVRGELADQHPMATAAAQEVTRWQSLYLGTLLHDVGKPLGKGHAEKGAQLTLTIGRRLGMNEEDIDTAEFLVRQHLTMAHISQRRDLSDPAVIARFASRVKDEQRLIQLYLCTLCDTAMTAPGNLSGWKERLLNDLYQRTRLYLRGDAEAEEFDTTEQIYATRRRVISLLSGDGSDSESSETAETASPEAGEVNPVDEGTIPGNGHPMHHSAKNRAAAEAKSFVAGVDERLFVSLTARQVARLIRLSWNRELQGTPAEIAISHYPLRGYSELCVVAGDRHGLLATIAAAMAANRIDVLGAIVGSRRTTWAGTSHSQSDASSPDIALDVFYVRDLYGKAIPVEDRRWQRFQEDLTALLCGERSLETETAMVTKRERSGLTERVTPGVATRIEINNQDSAEASVVEIFTQDRVGVLYAITSTLADMGLDILLSKVSTEGEQVADVFYVTQGGQESGQGSGKLTDPTQQRQLIERLQNALSTSD